MTGNDKFFEEELDRFGAISVPYRNWNDAVNVLQDIRAFNIEVKKLFMKDNLMKAYERGAYERQHRQPSQQVREPQMHSAPGSRRISEAPV